MKQPGNIMSEADAAELLRLSKEANTYKEFEALHAFVENHHEAIARCVHGWWHLEQLLRHATIDELLWYGTPGVFSLTLTCVSDSRGFDLDVKGMDGGSFDPEWSQKQLDSVLKVALFEIVTAEERERLEDEAE